MKATFFNIFVFVAVLMACACADSDSFTLSSSSRLDFSQDTLRLDTVFSTVPSSTRSFWVRNRGKDGVRCASVRLERGGDSGFRVNVDGVWLDPNQNHTAYGIDVHGKDSIRVFVELTAPANGGTAPKRLGDNIVFALENGREQKVALDAWAWDAHFLRDFSVSGDVTLPTDKPLVVYGMLRVEEGSTLTVPAGTTLFFHSNAGIDVKGRLLCAGTPDRVVTMRSDRLDRMFDYLPYDRTSGQWQGVRFGKDSYGNEIEYADIHGAFDGIVVDSSDVDRRTLDLRNTTVHNCQGSTLAVANSNVSVDNCQLTNALGHCLEVDGGRVAVNNSTIAQFYPFSSLRGEALLFSGTVHPLLSLALSNTIVTGYADNEVSLVKLGGDSAFKYSFANCLLRMPEAVGDDKSNFVNVIFENVDDTVSFGRKNFVLVDADSQVYDFHLREGSPAIGKADAATAAKNDHDGQVRDDNPDIGAYEFVEEKRMSTKNR